MRTGVTEPPHHLKKSRDLTQHERLYCVNCWSLRFAQEAGPRRQAPDITLLLGVPHLGFLRPVAMPGARVKIATLLVQHLVELGEELDHLFVRIAVIDRDVVAGAVTHRSPGDFDPALAEHVA